MSDRIPTRTLLALLAIGAVLTGVLVVGYGTSSGTAQSAEPTLDCVGSGGGAAYVATGSGLTVYENDSGIIYGTPRSERITFAFGTIGFSATGAASARLESGTGSVTCLGDVDATAADLHVAPDDESNVTLAGTYEGVAFRDVQLDPDDDSTDLVYRASAPDALTVHGLALPDGTTVMARPAGGGAELSSATVAGGSATFTGLPTGEHRVDLAAGGGAQGQFVVEILSATPSVTAGEQITVVADVENTGGTRASATAALSLDGASADDRTITLGPGDRERVQFFAEASRGNLPEASVAVDTPHDRDTTTVSVEARAGVLDVGDLEPRNVSVAPNETAVVTATITNFGGQAVTGPVTTTLAGQQVDRRNVTLSYGGSTRIQIELPTAELANGTYDFAVAVEHDTDPGWLRVGDGGDEGGPDDGEEPAPNGSVDLPDELAANASAIAVTTSNVTGLDPATGGTLVVENVDAGVEHVIEGVGTGTVDVEIGPDLPIAAGETVRATLYEGPNRTRQLAVDETTVAPAPVDRWWLPYVDDDAVVTRDGINAAVGDYLLGDLADPQINALVASYLTQSPVEEG